MNRLRLILAMILMIVTLVVGVAFPVSATAIPQPDPISIITAEAFQNIYQKGDVLIIFEYNIPYTTNPQPVNDCSDLFYCLLVDTSTTPETVLTLIQKPINNYGYNMAAFYFTSESADGSTHLAINWGDTNYAIEFDETPLFTPQVNPTYQFPLVTWETEPDMTLAQGDVQSYIMNSIILNKSTGLQKELQTKFVTTVSSSTVLNQDGRTLVIAAIPYLDTPIPQLFSMSQQQIAVGQTISPTTTTLQDNLTLQNQLGTQIATSFTNFGVLLHISGQQVAMGWILICCLIVVSIVFLATGNLIGATICALPMVLIGVWIGAIPVAFIFSAVMVLVVLLAFYLFIRGM
jgi:hypothetical protein